MNPMWGEMGEELGVAVRVGNAISVDIGAPPHSSKSQGPTESTSLRLGPLSTLYPQNHTEQLMPIFLRSQTLEPLVCPCQSYA